MGFVDGLHRQGTSRSLTVQTVNKLSREAGVYFSVAKPKGKWGEDVEYNIQAKIKGAEHHAAR